MPKDRRCGECGMADHHDPNCPEMFFRNRDGTPDRSKPRGVPNPKETERMDRLNRESRSGR